MKTKSILVSVFSIILLCSFIPKTITTKGDEYITPCYADSSLGKPVFIRAVPMNEYVEVDDVKEKVFKKAGDSEFGMDKIVTLASKAAKQTKDFDAIIIDKANKATLVKYKTNTYAKSMGKAQKVDGIDVFIYSTPVQASTKGETVEINNFGIGQMNNTGDDLERIVNGLVEKTKKKIKKKEIEPCDGIFIGTESMNKTLNVPVSSSGVVLRYTK
ncbi:MAG: hypothetical protein IPG89_02190 [Bacteroidetes bacterium]|nr:hypothetical protein [Bacteroidota bacterium]